MKHTFLPVILILALAIHARAAHAAAETRGRAILDAACSRIAESTSFTARVTFHVRMENGQAMTTIQDIAARRPAHFALRITEGNIGMSLVSNGETLVTHAPFLDIYSQEPAPKRFAALLHRGETWTTALSSGMGGVPIVQSLLADAPCDILTTAVTDVRFLGSQNIGEERCDCIRIEAPGFHWTLWITQGPVPVIRKIVPVFEARDGQPRMAMSLSFADWQLDTPIEEGIFSVTPPPDAEKVDSVLEYMLAQREEPMTGNPLPPVKLELMSGRIFTPAEQAGSHPVILYFWSLRDERTLQGLFRLASIAAQLEAAGILLCAVNVSDTRSGTLQAVMRLGIRIPVAADPEGEASRVLGITSVPWTVLVDREGRIIRRIIGLPEDFLEGIKLQMLPRDGAPNP